MIVKICGNTRREDLEAADKAGADMLGVVVEVEASARSQSREAARELFKTPTRARKAMLLCNHSLGQTLELLDFIAPDILHLTGNESPALIKEIRKSFHGKILKSLHLPAGGVAPVETRGILERMENYGEAVVDYIVMDASDPARNLYGGTGSCCDWEAAAEIALASPLPVLLAGGITPDNVCEAVETVNPRGIDLASGVEIEKGVKDEKKIRSLFDNLRSCAGKG